MFHIFVVPLLGLLGIAGWVNDWDGLVVWLNLVFMLETYICYCYRSWGVSCCLICFIWGLAWLLGAAVSGRAEVINFEVCLLE